MKPILLLHGICSNDAIFGPILDQGFSGRLEHDFRLIRGRLTCGRPRPGAPGSDFDTHLFEDLPRIWRQACNEAGETPGVFGYSMGGMLALTGQALGLIDAPRLFIHGSAFRFHDLPLYPALMRRTLAAAGLFGNRMIPIRLFGRLLFLTFTNLPSRLPPDEERLFYAMLKNCGVNVPVETLQQTTQWVTDGRLLNRAGDHDYLDDLGKVTAPVLFVSGARDRIAPVTAAEPAFERISSREKHLLTLPDCTHLGLMGPAALPTVATLVRSWFRQDSRIL